MFIALAHLLSTSLLIFHSFSSSTEIRVIAMRKLHRVTSIFKLTTKLRFAFKQDEMHWLFETIELVVPLEFFSSFTIDLKNRHMTSTKVKNLINSLFALCHISLQVNL